VRAAPTVGVLIGARALQGSGAALLVPQSLATSRPPSQERFAGVPSASGPGSRNYDRNGSALGGILIDTLGWRSVFWINLPLCACALWLTVTHVPESRAETVHGPLDWQVRSSQLRHWER